MNDAGGSAQTVVTVIETNATSQTARPGQTFAVVGGGMLGLTLALRLVGEGRSVTVFESAQRLGGLASAWTLDTGVDELVWDRHYHVTLESDSKLRAVLEELSLDDSISWSQTKTGIYAGGRLLPASNVAEFLRLPTLSLWDKLRLGATMFEGAKRKDWHKLEQIPVADWLSSRSGRHAFEVFWLPLLRAKLGDSYRETSAAFIWATIQRLNAARSAGLKTEQFGYVPGGYRTVLEAFARRLDEVGVSVRCSSRVEAVLGRDEGLAVVVDGQVEEFDRVVVTAPCDVAAGLCADLTASEKDRLRSVRYQGIVCASVVTQAPVSPYYLTYITDPSPLTAVVDMSALVSASEFSGRGLAYLPRYVASDDPIFERDDDSIAEEFLGGLANIYPDVSPTDVLAVRVSKARRVFAIPTLGYSTRVPPMETSVPGLHLVNSAQIVNATLNVNETVAQAEHAAAQLISRSATHQVLAP